MKNFVAAVALVALFASSALAGGPKHTTQIRVQNNSAGRLAIIVNRPDITNANIVAGTQASRDASLIVEGRGSVTIPVRAGNHVVRTAYLRGANQNLPPLNVNRIRTTNVVVGENQTVTLAVTGNANARPTVVVNP